MRPVRVPLSLLAAAAFAGTVACDDTTGGRGAKTPADAAPGSIPPPLGDDAGGVDAEAPAVDAAATAPPVDAATPADTDAGASTDAGADAAPDEPLACEDIPAAGPLDVLCETGDECGPGGVCAGSGGELRCLQLCIPARCEAMCPEGSTCRGILGPDGEPRELYEGSPLGVCYAPPPPAPAAYEPCGEAGLCGADLVCVVFAEAEAGGPGAGLCLPACEGEADVCPGDGVCTAAVDAAQPDVWFCQRGCDAPDACGEGQACLEGPAGLRCVPAAP
jgi:hypothetical protein